MICDVTLYNVCTHVHIDLDARNHTFVAIKKEGRLKDKNDAGM